MIEIIEKILEKYVENYAVVPNGDGTSSIVFFIPYSPYRKNDKRVFIDAYYKTSNEVYHLTNKIIKELNAVGIDAEREKAHIYKKVAAESGLVSPLKTTLTANEKYGTKIVLSVIKVKGIYEIKKKCPDLCIQCNKCVRACPTGAITDEGFKREKCLREMQNLKLLISDEDLKKMGLKVLGCDICQRACPVNGNIEETEEDQALTDLTDIKSLVENAYNGYKTLGPLMPYVGFNFLKKKRFLFFALNAAYNAEDYGCIETVKKLVDDPDGNIRKMACRLIEKYNLSQ